MESVLVVKRRNPSRHLGQGSGLVLGVRFRDSYSRGLIFGR